MRISQEIGGEIVNADSMQIYRDLRILTARPTLDQEIAAPHHLFGMADAGEAWSVGRWLRSAAEVLDQIRKRGRVPVVVGGTGLYFRALTHGLAEIPPVPESLRAEAALRFETLGEDAFRDALARDDPAAEARISRGDRQRLVRARAVFDATGRALTDWQTETTPSLAPGAWKGVAIVPPREALYQGCDLRLDRMIDDGALDEVAMLMARGLDRGLPAMKALGVDPFAAQLRGEISAAEALEQAKADTRRYAKRQVTWLRHQSPDWPRIETADHGQQWEALTNWVFHAPERALTAHPRDGMN